MIDHEMGTEPIADANIARLMVELLDTASDRPAFLQLDQRGSVASAITFGRLHQLVSAAAGGMRERGLGRGSRVVVFVPMGIELYICLLALLRIGAVSSFIEPWGGRRMVQEAAAKLEPDAFIGIPKSFLLRAASPSLRRASLSISTGARRIPGAERFADLLATPQPQHVEQTEVMRGDETALVSFSTGSTGSPKGTNRSHAILLAQHHALAHEVPNVDGARVWTNLPIVVLHNLGRGVETLLPAGSIANDPRPDPKALHELVDRSGATLLATSPAPLAQLVRAPGGGALRRVTQVYTGGGPVSPKLLEQASAMLPCASITALYGSTEAEPMAHARSSEVLERRDAMRQHGGTFVGQAAPDAELMIIRADRGPIVIDESSMLSDWAVGDGTPGELLVTGPHVNVQYWRDPDAVRANKIADETGRIWHRTGDIARRDEDGGIWLLGRRGGGWTMRGRRYWSLEVETPIADLPEIERAAICMPRFDGAEREFKNASAVLAVEPALGFNRDEAREAAVRSLRARGLADLIEVRSLRAVPVDRRHATKIDVPALQQKLKPSNDDDY